MVWKNKFQALTLLNQKNKIVEEISPELVGEPGDDLFELRNYIPSWVIHKMQLDRVKKK